MIFAAK